MKTYKLASLALSSAVLATVLLTACGKSASTGGEEAADARAQDESGDDHAAEAASEEATTLEPDMARNSGVRVAPAGSGRLVSELEVQGLLTPIDGSTAQATARFPGQLRALRANVGDRVRAGQTVATVESNLSLTTYPVAAPISGQVMSRLAQVGGGVAEGQPLFEIADLSKVWVDLHAFGADVRHLRAGARVQVTRLYDGAEAEVALERVLPGTISASQSAVARATLVNDDGLWRPGTAVSARIVTDDRQWPLVVPLSAVQTLEGREVVFVREGQRRYVARPVTLGERDGRQAEVRAGLRAGEDVVVEQSYLLKADIEKAGASHAH